MPNDHAKLSASASARWLTCTKSVEMYDKYVYTGNSSSFAQEGTCAHELAEICLTTNKTPDEFLLQTLNDAPNVYVDKEMIEHVQTYINYCLEKKGDHFVEERVNFSDYVPDGFGTSDFIAIDGNKCSIVDLKYGMGVEVNAQQNSQAMLYALGVIQEFGFIYDIEEFELCIYQPRKGHVSEWTISTKELLEWGEWVKEQAQKALSKKGEFNPSDKACMWCAHKPNCKALESFTESVIASEFDNLDLPDIDTVNVANILKHKSLIESFLKSVADKAKEDLESGKPVDGYKLVAGRSSRKWAKGAETKIIEILGDDAYEKSVLSVAKAEKFMGKAEFKEYLDLVEHKQGSPTIAPVSDKRPAITPSVDQFEVL